jgi:hypothetical protein
MSLSVPGYLTLVGFGQAFWPDLYTEDQLLTIRIQSPNFSDKGILLGDFALILKLPYARLHEGDVIACQVDQTVWMQSYSKAHPPKMPIIGKVIRTWRDYIN